jgi:hypothetical protein
MGSLAAVEQPDLEAWVWANIKGLGGVTSFSYTALTSAGGWVVAHYVQIDARAKSKKAASDLAEEARQLVAALPEVPWTEGTVCYVRAVEGPFWLPDDDGSPRYVARYEIRVHPRRTAPAGSAP